MPGKKILMLLGEFTEEYEIFVYQQAMEAVGHTVHVICPDKNAGDLITTSLHDFEGHQTYTEKLGPPFTDQQDFLGGRGAAGPLPCGLRCRRARPEYIRTRQARSGDRSAFSRKQKPIFTICHGVADLIAVDGVVRGKKVGAWGLRAGSHACRRHLYRFVADRSLCRWHHGFGQGLDRTRCLHPGMPQGARHRNPPQRRSSPKLRDSLLEFTRNSGWPSKRTPSGPLFDTVLNTQGFPLVFDKACCLTRWQRFKH